MAEIHPALMGEICPDCGKPGPFTGRCPECHAKNVAALAERLALSPPSAPQEGVEGKRAMLPRQSDSHGIPDRDDRHQRTRDKRQG